MSFKSKFNCTQHDHNTTFLQHNTFLNITAHVSLVLTYLHFDVMNKFLTALQQINTNISNQNLLANIFIQLIKLQLKLQL